MNQKSAQICIIGKPNAGKSTLLNSLIGQKISIVSPKVQTTRSSITGIITEQDTQLVFIDTPGIFVPKKKLEKAMVRAAWSSIVGSDFVAVIVDSTRKFADFTQIFEHLTKQDIQPIILLNKKDLVNNEQLDILQEEIAKIIKPQAIFAISAIYKNSCQIFIDYLLEKCPLNNWLYDEEQITNAPLRFLSSEITREQLFLNLDQELPYNLTVETEKWQDMENGESIVHHVIYVARESHKMIVLGFKGNMIKKISQAARREIEQCLDIKIHLYIYVKVRSDWENNRFMYEYMGLKLID